MYWSVLSDILKSYKVNKDQSLTRKNVKQSLQAMNA